MNRTEKLQLEQKIIAMLERQPKTARELYRHLGGVGSVQLNGVLRSLSRIGELEKVGERYQVVE